MILIKWKKNPSKVLYVDPGGNGSSTASETFIFSFGLNVSFKTKKSIKSKCIHLCYLPFISLCQTFTRTHFLSLCQNTLAVEFKKGKKRQHSLSHHLPC